MLKPKIGDTVVIRGVVTSIDSYCDTFKWASAKGREHFHITNMLHIEEIIPSPPVVGDMVTYFGCSEPEGRRLILVRGKDAVLEHPSGQLFIRHYDKLTKVGS